LPQKTVFFFLFPIFGTKDLPLSEQNSRRCLFYPDRAAAALERRLING